MPWIIGAAMLGSSALGAKGAKEQAAAAGQMSEAELQAQREALEFQREMYATQQEQMAPYIEAGQNALARIAAMGGEVPVDLTADPGYQFRLAEGQKMLERQLAGMPGGAASGRGMKEALRYGQQFGTQEYGSAYGRASDVYNRLANLAGAGQTSAYQTGALGAQMTPGIAGTMTGMGATRAAGIGGAAGARSSLYGGLGNLAMQGANIYQQQNMLNQMAGYNPTPAVPGATWFPNVGYQ